MLYVCALDDVIKTINKFSATKLITFTTDQFPVSRPANISKSNHLYLKFNDITSPQEGLKLPQASHITKLLQFVDKWDQTTPMLIHCFAGVSRSTAAAYITACYLNPYKSEYEIALQLRTASPSATPNSRMIELADKILNRQGQMIRAISKIGRGMTVLKCKPFKFEIQI